jgi:pantoate--beta-alanine ligase
MIEFKNSIEINEWCKGLSAKGNTVGFVPTMGALHEGHMSLIHQAKAKADYVVSSVFVNPTQFNDPKDFEKYPISLAEDKAMLTNAGCDAVFIPSVSEIYPESTTYDLNVDLGYLAECLEAKHRPGHFEGVMQVVKRLLQIVEPDILFLGRKDYQQFLVVKAMVKHYQLPVEVIQCPIVREEDGLAMSSRNRRLSAEEHSAALQLSYVLHQIQQQWKEKSPKQLQQNFNVFLNAHPLIKVEYLEIVNAETLQSIDSWTVATNAMVCVAAKVGEIRLIDNVTIY